MSDWSSDVCSSDLIRRAAKCLGPALPNNATFLNHVVVIFQIKQCTDVLIDNDLRESIGLQFAERTPDLLADERCQALGGLVKHEQAWVGHQRAANREPLLFAAR